MEKIVIVDANAIVHRSYHGFTPKYDKKGKDQRVLFGLIQELVDISFAIENIDYLFMVFDPEDGYLFRRSQYFPYKQNRKEKDIELINQQKQAEYILKNHIGIPLVSYQGYEADDIIGSIAHISKENFEIVIVSPDKDLTQLVETNITLLRKRKIEQKNRYIWMDEEKIFQEFGIYAKQIPDWLALVGDSSDNLPGLSKIGAKTASKLLNQYESIEHLIAIAHEIENEKLKKEILSSKESLILVKKLATIVKNLPIKNLMEESLIFATEIRKKYDYEMNLKKLESFFDWPEHYKKLFL